MQVMSVSELVALGWNRYTLMQIAHCKGSPAFKTCGGGKWMFDVKKLEKFVESRMANK